VIVVGVDHSEGAKEALRFTYEEARLRETPLRAVHAWRFGYIGAPGIESSVPVLGAELSEHSAVADASLAATVRETIPDVGEVTIERRVAEGAAAAVLVEESRGADLLVVGSRGHGGFAQLLLGSVSQQCAHHAECPVVIVHPRSGRTG
jgi:nucleotide-binding universal stress UspA family protein